MPEEKEEKRMKRFLAVLMLVVMMCGCVGLAEGKTFDPSVLEGKDGYSYDKFEKTWNYFNGPVAVSENNDFFTMTLMLQGEKSELKRSVILCAAAENSGATDITGITKIAIIADNDLITISDMSLLGTGMYVIGLTADNIETFKMIANAKSVTVRVYAKSVNNGHVDFEITADELASLQEAIDLAYTYELFSDYETGESITVESVE